MSTIFYMLRKEWKNRLLALFRHPGKLVVYILLVVLLVNSVISTALTPQADLGGFLDLRILHGAYLGILLLFTVPILLNALQKGTTFFGMSDVNLLFVSPISPKKILAYGLMKQIFTVKPSSKIAAQLGAGDAIAHCLKQQCQRFFFLRQMETAV